MNNQDFEVKEREFLEMLKADTGRDLGEWMQVLKEQNLAERNDRIDWLRHQGFIFAWAAWLERIYHNGGSPIYLSRVPESRPAKTAPAALKPLPDQDELPKTSAPVCVEPPAGAAGDHLSTESDGPIGDTEDGAGADHWTSPDDDERRGEGGGDAFDPFAALPSGDINTTDEEALVRVIGRAKAYAPLTGFLLGQIAQRLPAACAVPGRDHVALNVSRRKAATFAVVVVSGKDIKLGLGLGDWPVKPPFERVRFSGAAQKAARGLTHMITLQDARQVEQGLINLIAAAEKRARAK